MSNIHVCLVSDQPIPNLIPFRIDELRPEIIIFLVTSDMNVQFERLKKVINIWDGSIKIEKRPIEPYNLESAIETCLSTLAEIENEKVTLNVTGGTKIMALAAFEVFKEHSIIYVDTRDRQILQISPDMKRLEFKDVVKIKPYLAAYGQDIRKDDTNQVRIRGHYPVIEKLVSGVSGFEVPIGKLNKYAAEARKSRTFPCKKTIADEDFYPAFQELLEMLDSFGIVKLSEKTMEFPAYADACFASGDWLSEYVYHTVSLLSPKDLKMGVEVEWDQKGKKPTTNEYDVVFTLNNQLFLIECKTKRFEGNDIEDKSSDPIYKLGSLKDSAGGLFGKGMLVSYRKLTDDQKKRLNANRLEFCDGPTLKNLKDRIRQWIK